MLTYLVMMSPYFDIPNCCCPCHTMLMFVHNFSIDFVWMRIAVNVLMSQTNVNYDDDQDFVVLEMMHFVVLMFSHK